MPKSVPFGHEDPQCLLTLAHGAMKEHGPGWSDWLPVMQYLIISLYVERNWLLLVCQTVRKLVW